MALAYRLPLRIRFLVGLGAMLVPLLALTAAAVFTIGALSRALHQTVDDVVTRSMMPLTHLQRDILRLTAPLHDHLLGHADRRRFDTRVAHIDEGFDRLLAGPGLGSGKTQLIEEARQHWQAARPVAEAMLAIPRPQDRHELMLEMKVFTDHTARAVEFLEQAHQRMHAQIDRQLASARRLRQHALPLILTALIVGIAIAAAGSALLTRAVLRPMEQLERGTRLLGEGQLSHRVAVHRADEFGRLGNAFNAMAQRLEEAQARLEDLAIHDGLTGLLNHRELLQRLESELARAIRYRRPLALLMLDLDEFKEVNDRHGHQAGDTVLKAVADCLRGELRPVDQLARYGGEEFAVILPETSFPGAVVLAHRIHAAVGALHIDVGEGRVVRITISVGVASFPEDAESVTRLLASADRALYAAKMAGRNRVCSAHPESRSLPGPAADTAAPVDPPASPNA